MADDVTQPAPFQDAPVAQKPNKHVDITQVKNGFIVYAGPNTFVSYTFEELVEFLKSELVTGQ